MGQQPTGRAIDSPPHAEEAPGPLTEALAAFLNSNASAYSQAGLEIRKRVEAADRARVQGRADAAAAIATAVEQRTKVRAQLAELEVSIATQVKESAAVMTVEELAEFTGIPLGELRPIGRAALSRKASRSTPTRGRSARTGTRAQATPPKQAAPSNTAGDASATA